MNPIRLASFVLLILVACSGCSTRTGPASTETSSASLPTHAERVTFLERYVTFRRRYTDLGFRIAYRNNSEGWVPGPSDWDIRLVAVVPTEQLAEWIPPGQTASPTVDTQWLVDIPDGERAATITEWYRHGGITIGIDRDKSLVAYRNQSQ